PEPSAEQIAQRVDAAVDGVLHTLAYVMFNIYRMQAGNTLIQSLQAWQVQVGTLLQRNLETSLQENILSRRLRLLIRKAPE
ncbi:hypothetical protein, partial [Pseudomonas syringae group genomosp. 7]|uniref:hypothetical protein n=1 Tax=Pseudomonas syringae group genomosp. 7 TaxID=251699 RepID=UPI00376FA341